MARRITAVLLLIAAPLVSAQTNTITVTRSNGTTRPVNIAECKNDEPLTLTFSFTYTGFVTSGTYTLIASDTSGCPSTAKNKTFDNIPATAANGSYPTTGAAPVSASTLLGDLGIVCPGPKTAVHLCVDYLPSSGASVTNAITGVLELDLARPPPPVVAKPTPGDGALNISWTPGAGDSTNSGSSSSYDVVVTRQADTADTRTQSVTGSRSTRVGGLLNDQPYDVIVFAYSTGGNKSGESNKESGTPVPVDDFWRLYREALGREQGGCSTGSAGTLALLALAPWALRRRRRP